jgi:5-methylcytosine-specific restriction endonuclease McrA
MQPHTREYFKYFKIGHSEDGSHDFIPCEICRNKSVDIHHINGRWHVENSNKIENLIALCRKCHEDAHAGILTKGDLHVAHYAKINGPM